MHLGNVATMKETVMFTAADRVLSCYPRFHGPSRHIGSATIRSSAMVCSRKSFSGKVRMVSIRSAISGVETAFSATRSESLPGSSVPMLRPLTGLPHCLSSSG